MKKGSFTLRPINSADLTEAMKLSTGEGWNQTQTDWKFLIGNPGNVCMVAETSKHVIGTTTAINYSDDVAWIGMVLVNREYRGLGVAKTLLTNVLNQVKNCKSVKLDATPAGQQVYQNFGFKDEYVIARMTNTMVKELTDVEVDTVPERIQPDDLPEIIGLDELTFGTNRGQLIRFFLNRYPAKGWVLKRDKKISGFVLGRDGNKFHHVGPLVAKTTKDAKILVSKALSSLVDQPVAVDILGDKDSLIELLKTIGFIEQRKFIRMYKDVNPFPGLVDQQYLICGPEFG